MQQKIFQDKKTIVIILLGIIFLISIPLMIEGVGAGHDIRIHLLRIEGIAEGLKNGVFPVKLSSVWLEGYGYPISVYYGDALLYIPAILRCLGVPNIAAYGIFVFLVNVATVVSAYYCFGKIAKSQRFAVLACLVYVTSPYRLITVFIRAAVGEYCAFIFLPVIALAMYRIYTEQTQDWKAYRKNAIVLALGMTGLIETHILSVELVVLILAAVCLVLWKKTVRPATLKVYGIAVVETVVLNLFFIVPFLDYYKNVAVNINRYTSGNVIRQIQYKGVRVGELFMFFRDPFSVGTLHNYERMLFTPGIILMTVLVMSIVLIIYKKSSKEMVFYTGFTLAILFMSTNIFPWDAIAFTTFGNWLAQVQFPWRYLGIANVFLILLMMEILQWVWRNKTGWKNGILIAAVAVSIISTSYFAGNYTDDAILYEYATNMELDTTKLGGAEYLRADTDKETLTGNVSYTNMEQVDIVSRKGTTMELYCLSGDFTQGGTVEVPMFNYKGYYVMDEAGNEYEITDGENNVISFQLPQGFEGNITVEFREPWYWRVAEIVSLLAVLGWIGVLAVKARRGKIFPMQNPDGNIIEITGDCKEYRTVLFDLDGTLTDPGTGITNSVAYALKKYGIEISDRTELYKFIGPPLLESFEKYYGFSKEQAREAVDFYREYFRDKGIFENMPYDGVKELLEELKKSGRKIVLATSKPEEFAVRILEHFDLMQYFDVAAGASMDETRTKKAQVIAYALEQCKITDLSQVVMIGDREHDIIGAKQIGIDSIGVLFGYGNREELQKAGATYIAERVDDILPLL